MRKIIGIEAEDFNGVVHFRSVDKYNPIFAKREGKLCGMVVKEYEGWILKLGGFRGSNGFHSELLDCLRDSLRFGYTYFVED